MNHAICVSPHPLQRRPIPFRLEAQWACFFDLANWNWEYEPMDLVGWTPTFRVEFPCGHSECPDTHVLLIDVQPFDDIESFAGRRCMDFAFGECWQQTVRLNPSPLMHQPHSESTDVTYWEMGHGAGGGLENVQNWVFTNAHELWKTAGNIIRGCS